MSRPRLVQTTSLAGAAGAAITSAAAGICCIGPLALTLLGVNGMIFAAGLRPYRFYLLGVSLVFLGFAYWATYRPVAPAASCPTRAGKLSRIVLWVASGLWIGAFILQFVANRLWLGDIDA